MCGKLAKAGRNANACAGGVPIPVVAESLMVVIAAGIVVAWFVLNVALPLLGAAVLSARRWVETCPEPAPRKPGVSRPGLTRVEFTQPAIPAWLDRFSLKSLALTALRLGLVMGLVHLLTGCGGAASDTDAPADATDATPDAAAPAQTSQKRVIPLCEGSPAESPELCQELRYGDHGYCNAWGACR